MIMNISIAIPDRRLTHRHTLRIPLQLRIGGADGPMHGAESIDLSARGALLETDVTLWIGAAVELRLKLPEEITGQPTTEWRCRGRIVRVVQYIPSNTRSSVAVRFESLDVSRL
jgi:PilZ domain